MEKKSTKIAYFVALGIFIVLLVILGLQFKGKENPVFVGDGAFYTTGDGVFLDGILSPHRVPQSPAGADPAVAGDAAAAFF